MGRQRTFSDFELGEKLKRLGRRGAVRELMEENPGLTESAIYKRLRKVQAAVSGEAVRHAEDVFAQELDASEQLIKINNSANRILNLLESQLEQDRKEVGQKLKGSLLELEKHLDPEGKEVWGPAFKVLDLGLMQIISLRSATLDQLLKAQAEIRQQLKLLLDIHQVLFDIKQIVHYKQVLLEEICAESPECGLRIMRRLEGSNSLRLLLGGTAAEAAN